MSENNFSTTVESLFRGMDGFISTKTVVGDAIKVNDDTIILPLVDVSFGVGAGAYAGEKKSNAGGGLSGKISPNSVLVLQNGSSKIVSVKEHDSVSKILDMVPDIINKFTKGKKKEDIDAAVEDAIKNQKEAYHE